MRGDGAGADARPADPARHGGGPGFLAHIPIAKICDHIPLYRQAEIYARSGFDIDRGQLAEWLGHLAWPLKPLAELIAEHVMAGRVIHADDTPVPVLAPGAGKTKTGRQWVYLRDERPHGGSAPPAVLYRYTPDRKGEHCRAELAQFVGRLHADGYAGFGRLYEITGAASSPLPLQGPPRVAEVACWAHIRSDQGHRCNFAVAQELIGAHCLIENVTQDLTAVNRAGVTESRRWRSATARRAEKGRVLDELCALTGWHRMHAMRALASARFASGAIAAAATSHIRSDHQ